MSIEIGRREKQERENWRNQRKRVLCDLATEIGKWVE